MKCPICNGTGELADETKCATCDGTGHVNKTRTTKMKNSVKRG